MEVRKSILATLFKLSKADEHYNLSEFLYMMNIGENMGFSEDQIRNIQINASEYTLQVPETEHERMTIFYYALFLMKADKKATESEINFVRKIGFQLGFGDKMTEELIQQILQNLEGEVNPENMLSIIRKHMN